MKWYVGHAVMCFRVKSGVQREFRAWENVYLIAAESFEEARRKAEARAREAANDDPTLRYNDQPAELVFVGVRKVLLCEDEDLQPSDGTEVTYSEFELATWDEVERLGRGAPTDLSYEVADFSESTPDRSHVGG